MSKALVALLLIVSLVGLDRRQAKAILRRAAVFINRLLLRAFSRDYPSALGATLVFAPHADDETLGCGALIARKRNDGLPVDVIFITDGSASHPGHPRLAPAEIAALRRREARAALAFLGVESEAIHFLDAPDGQLPTLPPRQRREIVLRLTELLLALKPQEIFLPCSPDGSSEHEAAFVLIHEAVRRSGSQVQVWQYPVWSWWNPLLLLQHTIRSRICCRVPAEDFRFMKLKAIGCYQSQTAPLAPEPHPSLPPELVRLFETDEEYFFQFDLTARAEMRGREAPPAIV
jgi:LmbE family N-acetylglucosaminyl deacetylase